MFTLVQICEDNVVRVLVMSGENLLHGDALDHWAYSRGVAEIDGSNEIGRNL